MTLRQVISITGKFNSKSTRRYTTTRTLSKYHSIHILVICYQSEIQSFLHYIEVDFHASLDPFLSSYRLKVLQDGP
jgi:hypothetical protein